MAQADDVPKGEAKPTARALLAAADLFFNPVDGWRTPEDLPIRWAVSFAIEPVLEKMPSETQTALLVEAVNGPSPIFATFMVTSMSVEHGRAGDKDAKTESERKLPLASVIKLEQELRARLARDALSGALERYDDAAGMIWTWANLAGEETVRDWIANKFDEPGFKAWLMRTFTGEGTAHSFGDMVGQRTYTVDRHSLSNLLDVDRLQGVAEKVVADGKDENNAAEHFLAGLKSRY